METNIEKSKGKKDKSPRNRKSCKVRYTDNKKMNVIYD